MQNRPSSTGKLMSYLQSLLIVGVVSLVNMILVPLIGYHAAGFVYLLAVMVLGLFLTLGPVLFAAVLTALSWDFLFIPPTPNLRMSEPGDLCMMIAYICAAMITGTLTQQIRNHESKLRSRQGRLSSLYEVVREIAGATNFETMISTVTEQVSLFFGGNCAVRLVQASKSLEDFSERSNISWLDPEERKGLTELVKRNKIAAGWGTSTCADASALCLPLLGSSEFLGVIIFKPLSRNQFIEEDKNLLFAIARQLAVALEREIFQERALEAKRLVESEKLHQTILDSISHEIRTPLTALIGLASALVDPKLEAQSEKRALLAENLVDAGERLNHVVENILDMSRMTSGALSLKRDWHDLTDVVSVSITQQQKALAQHEVIVKVQEGMPLVRLDFQLFEQAIANLLRNAATYSPSQTQIAIDIGHEESKPFVKVSDQGPGIAPEVLPYIFEKFYRIPGSKPGGTGLGLTIAKGITEAHGGVISAANCLLGGTQFKIILPEEKQPLSPEVEKNEIWH